MGVKKTKNEQLTEQSQKLIEKGEIVPADEYDITFEGKKEGTLIKENYEDFSQWTYEGSKKTFDTRKEALDAFTAQIKPTEAQINPVIVTGKQIGRAHV